MRVEILETCRKEIKKFPENIKMDLFELVNDLSCGLNLSMPLSRKMDGMGRGVFELRLRDSSGAYRVIYYIKKKEAIYLVHGFKKKTQKTPQKNVTLAIKRIKGVL